jgi:ferrochelatase
MTVSYQAVLLIAFGGPTAPEEIRPFLERVLKGVSIPQERMDEVVRHYEAVGGKSPINEITQRQAQALQKLFNQRGMPLSVYVGMRNSTPFFAEALKHMADDSVKQCLGFILSSHRTEASWERYQKNIADARAELGRASPEVDYCEGWHDHPLFIRSWSERIESIFASLGTQKRSTTPLVFTAHSIPTPMAVRSRYVEQLQTTARMIAAQVDHRNWVLAFQSRSGKPSDPWLEPDIAQVIKELSSKGTTEIVVAPIGFVCDHVEVLYDLDIEAKKLAREAGINFMRASCPNDDPTFVRMIADIVATKLAEHSYR